MAEPGATLQELVCLDIPSAEGAIHCGRFEDALSALCPDLHSVPGPVAPGCHWGRALGAKTLDFSRDASVRVFVCEPLVTVDDGKRDL